MDIRLANLKDRAARAYQENKQFFRKLRRKPPRHLDSLMQELHDEEFEQTDCLQCAQCCKTTGPLFTRADIERIAKKLKMKPGVFIDTYLQIDEEQDYVLQEVPCTFLGHDNHCMIYDYRPKACREFPHTDRRNFHQISDLTLKNVAICPAAFQIVEKMKARLSNS
ncbi:MAG: YkgJ family cysteine cluster protein [Eudoraea sp.]|nr:YkgJ family cysteine cluster protein [Eudoraea sp.]NND15306.1 YkgJ family cysteine cluster protein [Eudoraea sp.]